MELQDQMSSLKGIGPKKAEALKNLNLHTLEDLIYFFPRDYENRKNIVEISNLQEGISSVIRGTVQLIVPGGSPYSRKRLLKLLVSDDSGSLEVVFFHAKYLMKSFQKGKQYIFFGKAERNYGKLQMVHPEFSRESEGQEGILPIYPLTKGISQREMRSWQKTAMPLWQEVGELVSEERLRQNRLCSISYALEHIHFPQEKQKLLEAKYRLIFDELLVLQTGLFLARQTAKESAEGTAFSKTVSVQPYIDALPYSLTGAQKRCMEEITKDLESGSVMNRLVQGDVGSGKTAVAEIAMYKAVKCGYQAVLMAPTEILARQHYEGLRTSFAAHGIKVGFLTGSMKTAEKRQTLEQLAEGTIEILIGTHAVIQPEVAFRKLGLVITDEQHRFGVNQRVRLKEKGQNPNVLVMTATPIPRTLAVVLYGDLDVSVIDELPPGRRPIRTKNFDGTRRNDCYNFVRQQLEQGRQAYVVTPLIEESEMLDAKSVQQVAEELAARFSEYRVALLYGSMKQAEKDEIMEQFYRGEIDILVATVVIEVGINVPNATVIVVENAERFGLAQLHQLRGRVGRGVHQSYCFLITEGQSEIAMQRASIMEQSSDGFFIAEEDLKLRGPGEIFGTRQHGLPDLNLSDLAKHFKILNHAKELAREILQEDPLLNAVENQPLKRRVTKFFGEDFNLNL